MSESNSKTEWVGPSVPAGSSGVAPVEASDQRRLKYGANLILNIVLVLAVAGIAIWGADRYHMRADVTGSGANSLRPQTLNVLRDLQTPIRIVSLYPKLKQEQAGKEQDFYTPVANVLEEYRRGGRSVDVQIIDPVDRARASSMPGSAT